jgi:hypothetical protein
VFQDRLLFFVASEFSLWDLQNGTQEGHGPDVHGPDFYDLFFDPVQTVIPHDFPPIFQSTTSYHPFNDWTGVFLEIDAAYISIPKEMRAQFHIDKDTKSF